MEPFLRMKLMSNGAFYSCVFVVCVCASVPTNFEYWLLFFIIHFITYLMYFINLRVGWHLTLLHLPRQCFDVFPT